MTVLNWLKLKLLKNEVKIKKEKLQREYERNKPYNIQNRPKQKQVFRLIPPVEDNFIQYKIPTSGKLPA